MLSWEIGPGVFLYKFVWFASLEIKKTNFTNPGLA